MTQSETEERLLQQLVETPAGERIRMKCGAADLRSVLTDLLSLIDTRAPVDSQPNWNIAANEALLNNWPIRDVLNRLAEAATHLLSDHDCDAHGYEGLQHAVVAAREHASLIDSGSYYNTDGSYNPVGKNIADHAATQMRTACVEKVKRLRDEWETKRNGLEPLSKMRNRYDAAFCAANEIITALESLTLDQVKQK